MTHDLLFCVVSTFYKEIGTYFFYEIYRYQLSDTWKYLYTYRVYNDESTTALSIFCISILEDAEVRSPGFEYGFGEGEVMPTFQSLVGNPPQSVTYLFMYDQIDCGEYSALLTFESSCPPTFGFGTISARGVSATEELPTPNPIPEVATVVLLGLGIFFLLPSRKVGMNHFSG